MYAQKGEYEKSLEFYNKALEQAEYPGYLLNIAIAHFMMGNKGIARQKYEEVAAIDPVGFSGKLDKVFGAAKASLSSKITEGPKFEVPSDLAAELKSETPESLAESAEVSKNIKPEDIPKINYRKSRARSDNTVGVTFARLGNYSMAIDYFQKAVKSDPEELDYKVNFAVAYYRMYKYDQALTLYEEIKKKKPELVTQLDFIESMGEITPKFSKFD